LQFLDQSQLVLESVTHAARGDGSCAIEPSFPNAIGQRVDEVGDVGPIKTSGVSTRGAASPDFLLTRSVDQVGRKSEMTRVIAPTQNLHFRPHDGGSVQQASGAFDAGTGRQHRNPPKVEVDGLGLAPPAAQCDPDGAGFLGAKLEPPRCAHRQARHLGDNGAKAAMLPNQQISDVFCEFELAFPPLEFLRHFGVL
jgi:hypothetical protein